MCRIATASSGGQLRSRGEAEKAETALSKINNPGSIYGTENTLKCNRGGHSTCAKNALHTENTVTPERRLLVTCSLRRPGQTNNVMFQSLVLVKQLLSKKNGGTIVVILKANQQRSAPHLAKSIDHKSTYLVLSKNGDCHCPNPITFKA